MKTMVCYILFFTMTFLFVYNAYAQEIEEIKPEKKEDLAGMISLIRIWNLANKKVEFSLSLDGQNWIPFSLKSDDASGYRDKRSGSENLIIQIDNAGEGKDHVRHDLESGKSYKIYLDGQEHPYLNVAPY